MLVTLTLSVCVTNAKSGDFESWCEKSCILLSAVSLSVCLSVCLPIEAARVAFKHEIIVINT